MFEISQWNGRATFTLSPSSKPLKENGAPTLNWSPSYWSGNSVRRFNLPSPTGPHADSWCCRDFSPQSAIVEHHEETIADILLGEFLLYDYQYEGNARTLATGEGMTAVPAGNQRF